MGYKANIASNLVNQVLRIILGAAISIIGARVLGPEGMGYAAYTILIFTLVGDFGHFGLNNAVMYFKKRSDHDNNLLYNVNITTLAVLGILLSAAILACRITGTFLTEYNYFFIAGGIVFVFSDLLFTNFHSWYVGDERIRESNRYSITAFFIKCAVILLLWATKTLTPLTWFLSSSLAMLLNAVFLGNRINQGYKPAFSIRLLKEEYAYGGIIWFAAAFAFLHYRVDQLMIKEMLGVAHLGVYSIAVVLAEMLFLVPQSINSALLGKLYNTDSVVTSRRLVSQTFKLSLYVCAVLALLGIPLSYLIPAFYGKAYSGAVFSTQILLVGAVFASAAKVSAQYFFSIGKPSIHLGATFATLALNIGLNFLFIPTYGIAGAAIASSISYVTYGLYYLAMFLFREKFTFNELFKLQVSDLRNLWSRP
jgi:O-antigen/teichoic acid export membrane protein